MLQIYNESIHDLLAVPLIRLGKPAALKLKEDKAGHITVPGLSEVCVMTGLGRGGDEDFADGLAEGGGACYRPAALKLKQDKAGHMTVPGLCEVCVMTGLGGGGGGPRRWAGRRRAGGAGYRPCCPETEGGQCGTHHTAVAIRGTVCGLVCVCGGGVLVPCR